MSSPDMNSALNQYTGGLMEMGREGKSCKAFCEIPN